MSAHLVDIHGYHQMMAVIKAQKESRGLSDKDLEHIAELSPGHWSKIVAGVKSLGPLSMGRVLRAVGLKLRPFIDEDAIARTSELYLPRTESQVRKPAMQNAAVQFKLSRKFLSKIGAKGGANSRRNLGKRARRKLARRAAFARWRKPVRVRSPRPNSSSPP